MRRRLTLLAGVVLVLALGLGVNTVTEHTSPSGSVATAFGLGEDARFGTFQVHVHGARAAAALDHDGEEVVTAGVWVILDMSFATTHEPDRVHDVGVRDSSGRTFTTSSRSPGNGWGAAPDTWVRGELAFEVPADALGEFTVFVWPTLRSDVEGAPIGYGVTRVHVTEVESEPATLAEPVVLPAGER
ncbi:hypothetical protein [Ruania halotolerans]|uniref:hypothetical protein n=1 Tax=Ruania halotolerans TaxID=2897773 RepID=UPI001E5D39E9|nr:hypothetical protein [Ruania halotolerans]UFU07060.1 hypothetical protein LQF10_02805 [Ruania halotolerans]